MNATLFQEKLKEKNYAFHTERFNINEIGLYGLALRLQLDDLNENEVSEEMFPLLKFFLKHEKLPKEDMKGLLLAMLRKRPMFSEWLNDLFKEAPELCVEHFDRECTEMLFRGTPQTNSCVPELQNTVACLLMGFCVNSRQGLPVQREYFKLCMLKHRVDKHVTNIQDKDPLVVKLMKVAIFCSVTVTEKTNENAVPNPVEILPVISALSEGISCDSSLTVHLFSKNTVIIHWALLRLREFASSRQFLLNLVRLYVNRILHQKEVVISSELLHLLLPYCIENNILTKRLLGICLNSISYASKSVQIKEYLKRILLLCIESTEGGDVETFCLGVEIANASEISLTPVEVNSLVLKSLNFMQSVDILRLSAMLALVNNSFNLHEDPKIWEDVRFPCLYYESLHFTLVNEFRKLSSDKKAIDSPQKKNKFI
ncbi:hypothetical protein MP638_007085 [Amoeboaphelidium occidentale]|nr:hypothetical protein MP638_007085 [Amoeboaphelidium occidentale]